MKSRHQILTARLQRVHAARLSDRNRHKPSPLGPGFLTRNERWLEVIWELERQLKNTPRVWFDEADKFCS